MSRLLTILLLGLTLFGIHPSAHALKSDRDQPATIDADEVDIDFKTGVRTYRGNVVVQQGSLVINADELVVYLKDDKLEKAIATGRPAVFRQRPDGKDQDVVGKGRQMELDEINNIMILTKRASVTQGSDTINGENIVYNMATDKLKVRGGQQPKTTQGVNASTDPTASDQQTSDSTNQIDNSGVRPRIVIQPRSKAE